ncbi:MAG: UDP-N-acetylmuramoyl-L-alanyl-D-glutamate--2,6-diaminopimelate ligase [Alphaproteobacteria bacterium]
MKLDCILKKCRSKFNVENFKNIIIKGITTNSQKVRDNFVFGTLKGARFNGELFLKNIFKYSPLVIILKKNSKTKISYEIHKNIIVIKTENVKKLVLEIASIIYENSLKEIVAVTGTNGKTSVCDYTRQLWTLKNIKSASIGTLGIILKNKKIEDLDLTTPDSCEIQSILYLLSKNNCEKAIIEASSIGLDQERLKPLKFNKVVFTNLTLDHLDYHKNFTNYKKSKAILFHKHTNQKSMAIINTNSINSSYFKKICKKKNIPILDYGKDAGFLKIKEIQKFEDFYEVNFVLKKKEFSIKFRCFSMFEIYNKIAALIIVFGKKINPESFNLLKTIKNPSGRLEKIKNKKKLNIFIDYAHTPDALKNVLFSLKKNCKGKIITVFGCGGNRDKSKRPLMTLQALKYSELVVITNDNPRNENPKNIRNDMTKNLKKKHLKIIKEISSRKKAITYSINQLSQNDFLLIAGKGHEQYQIIKNKKSFFSDKKTVLDYINQR